MTKSTRVFVAFACATALFVGGTTVALATAVYRSGIVEVQVAGRDHVSIRVPGFLLPVAASLVPKSALEEAAKEIAPYLPAARAAFDELARCEDGVFVEVDGKGEHVRIGKKDGVFFVDVQSDGETVHVSIPLHAVGPVLARLESVARQVV